MLFSFFLFISTFTISSGSSSALCPVCVIVCFPSSITIAFVTHLRNAKSNSFGLFGTVTVITLFSTFIVTFTFVPSFNVTSFVVISSFSLNDALSNTYAFSSSFLLTYTVNSSSMLT